MTTAEWLAQAKANREVLRALIAAYHPSTLRPHADTDPIGPDITAPDAERACEVVRQQVRVEWMGIKGSACEAFDSALEAGDVDRLNTMLNQSWFGVPESTSCWLITGFKEAVALMEDLPDEG